MCLNLYAMFSAHYRQWAMKIFCKSCVKCVPSYHVSIKMTIKILVCELYLTNKKRKKAINLSVCCCYCCCYCRILYLFYKAGCIIRFWNHILCSDRKTHIFFFKRLSFMQLWRWFFWQTGEIYLTLAIYAFCNTKCIVFISH